MLYVKNNPDELWWCNSHQRRATYIDELGWHHCDPKLPGIMIPCQCVNLTGIAEIEDDSPTTPRG